MPMGWGQNNAHMLGRVLSQHCAPVPEQDSCPQARDDAVPVPACWGQCHVHVMGDQTTTC